MTTDLELCRHNLKSRVDTFRESLLSKSALTVSELGGHTPRHYFYAARAFEALQGDLAHGLTPSPKSLSDLNRAFYRANELVQLNDPELREFLSIISEATQLGETA